MQKMSNPADKLKQRKCTTLTDIVVRTMARAEPASVVTRFANWHTTQMSAHTQHDEPLGLLGARLVALGVAEALEVGAASFGNLVRGAVADEYGLAAPLDDDVLALGDGGKVELDLGHREHVRRCGHRREELGHRRLGRGRGEHAERADHEVREPAVRRLGPGLVLGEVGDVWRVVDGGGRVQEALLVDAGHRGCMGRKRRA